MKINSLHKGRLQAFIVMSQQQIQTGTKRKSKEITVPSRTWTLVKQYKRKGITVSMSIMKKQIQQIEWMKFSGWDGKGWGVGREQIIYSYQFLFKLHYARKKRFQINSLTQQNNSVAYITYITLTYYELTRILYVYEYIIFHST